MRRLVIAVGRPRETAWRTLWDGYAQRLSPPLELVEVEERRPLPAADRKAREGRLLLDAIPPKARVCVLDGRGECLDSDGFAKRLTAWADAGAAAATFLIGGADGHDPAVLARADLVLALGTMTWPHQLARVMLAEQIYRADSIRAGHPYHRGNRDS